MSLVETEQRERALWILKNDGYRVLALTEDDKLLLSEPFKRKKQAKALLEQASSIELNPVSVLGPTATVIPLSDVSDMRIKPSRGFIDLETEDAVHRISGWGNGPTVVGGDRGMGYTMFGAGAIEDASSRIRSRRRPGQDAAAVEIPEDLSELSGFTTVTTFSYTARAEIVSFVLQAIMGAGLVAFSVAFIVWPQPGISKVWVGLIGLISGGTLLGSKTPQPLEVDHQGIRWSKGRQRHDVQWQSISGFDIVKPRDRRIEFRNGVSLFVKSQQPGNASTLELPIASTHFLSDRKLQQFLAVVRYYRPDLTLTPKQIRPAVTTNFRPKRPKKPVLENGTQTKPQLGRLLMAILLGLGIPIGLIALVVLTG